MKDVEARNELFDKGMSALHEAIHYFERDNILSITYFFREKETDELIPNVPKNQCAGVIIECNDNKDLFPDMKPGYKQNFNRFYDLVAKGETIGLTELEEEEYKTLKPEINPRM